LLDELGADVLARRRSLAEAAGLLAASGQGHNPNWLSYLARLYPGRSPEARLAANLLYSVLFSLEESNAANEDSARRLAADYRACYGVTFQFPAELAAPASGRWRVLSDDPEPTP
jgi:hypothetical protein